LRQDGYDVTEVADGGRLLITVTATYAQGEDRDAYDLLITDIRMPVVSGLQIVEGLRKAHWRVPIILMTAFGDAGTRARAEGLGAVLLDKPFDIDDLRTAVLNLAPRAGARSLGRVPR
jgi:DNA-binding response OmpR family regulator